MSSADNLMHLREQIARSRARSGYHPYWTTAPVVAGEPLWAVSFRARGREDWVGPYRTAAPDLDEAIAEARAYLRAPKRAEVSVLATVPRSDTYRGAKDMLYEMLAAVPARHPEAGAMLEQLREALRVVSEAETEGHCLSGLTVSLAIALEVDEYRSGRPRRVKTVTWGDHGGDWPEWNRCTV